MAGMRSVLVLAASAMLLSGCAAAIPLVAAGAIVRQQAGKDGDKGQKPPSDEPAKRADASSPAKAPALTTADDATPLPPVAAGEERPLEGPYGAFLAFATVQLARMDGAGLPDSVMLAPGFQLDAPVTMPCGEREPAVMIDLDVAPSGVAGNTDGLKRALTALRDEEVTILWLTRRSSYEMRADGRTDTAALHDALVSAGLDPDRKDKVLGIRPSYKDRIQLVRQDAARDLCVIAMAGDTKSDFDEVFDYLKQPEAAYALDKNWGAGWFLLPPPLLAPANKGN